MDDSSMIMYHSSNLNQKYLSTYRSILHQMDDFYHFWLSALSFMKFIKLRNTNDRTFEAEISFQKVLFIFTKLVNVCKYTVSLYIFLFCCLDPFWFLYFIFFFLHMMVSKLASFRFHVMISLFRPFNILDSIKSISINKITS